MVPLVSRERAGNKVGDALRLYVGRGRRYSVKQLSNGTGIKDRVIECAMEDAGGPDYRPLPPEALISISLFLGADFTSEWLSLAQQGAFDFPDGDEPRPGDMAVEASEHTTEIVRRAADGVFDDADRRALKVVGQAKMRNGMRLIAMAGRGERKRAA
jgi:hypothetical protein